VPGKQDDAVNATKPLERGSLADRIHALMCAHHEDEGYTEGELARHFDVPMPMVRSTLEQYAKDDYFKRDVASRRWMLGDLVIDRPTGPYIVPASPWQAPLPAGEAVGFDEVPPAYKGPTKKARLVEQIDRQLTKPGLCLEDLALSDRVAVRNIVGQRHASTLQRYLMRKASATTFNLYRMPDAKPAKAKVRLVKKAA
jgi:hypothetical protein